MSKLKIALLVHENLLNDLNLADKNILKNKQWACEKDVYLALKELGHDCQFIGAYNNVSIIIDALKKYSPDIVFNLFEQFGPDTKMEGHVVCLLEMLGYPYTGCHSKGLVLARDKALTKHICVQHNLMTPHFFVIKKDDTKFKLPDLNNYPYIVKAQMEEASFSLGQSSVVHTKEKLAERIQFLQELEQDIIVEEYIPGREFNVGIIGGDKILTTYPWEVCFDKSSNPAYEVYGHKAKWDESYRDKKGVISKPADLSATQIKQLQKLAEKAYRAMELTGPARMDYRMNKDGVFYLLEVNPNPNLAKDDELALSYMYLKKEYGHLIKLILNNVKAMPNRNAA